MKLRAHVDPKQPDWVCRDCGGKWGLWWDGGRYYGPPIHCATYSHGTCGVCGAKTGVTEARDYGYLKEGWHKHSPSVHLDGSNQPSNEGQPQITKADANQVQG
ncbi:MAG: hypothetical protein ACO4AV_15880 [bacterium]